MELLFNYNDHEIVFQKDEDVMVNATQMANAFNKRIDFFMKAEHTKAFIFELEQPPYGGQSEGQKVFQNRGHQGLWVCRPLALKLAAWLNPAFEVWVYQTIEEILFGNQFNQVRNWFDQTTLITNREREIKQTLSRLNYAIKAQPVVKKRKGVMAIIRNLESDMRLRDRAIERAMEVFSPDDSQALTVLIESKRELAAELEEKSLELEKLNVEYNQLSQVIEMTALRLERKEGTRKKTTLTKSLYQGQLLPVN